MSTPWAPTFRAPPIGGLLFTAAVILPFGLDMGAFLFVVTLLAGLRDAFGARPAAGASPPSGVTAEVWEGMAWLWRHRVPRTLTALVGAMNLSFGMMLGVLVLFVPATLHLPRQAYGPLLATFAAGGLLDAAVAVRIGPQLRSPRMLRAALFVQTVGAAGTALRPVLAIVIPAFLVIGFLTTVWDIVVVSYRQHIVSDSLLGRVTSAFRFVGIGASPLGTILGGLIAEFFGLRAPFAVAAVIMLLALLPSLSVLRREALVVTKQRPQRLPIA